MPSALHEGIIALFRARPAIVELAIKDQLDPGVLRAASPYVGNASVDRRRITPYASDLVIVFQRENKPVFA